MKKNILIKTNLLVCLIIIIGFAATSIISYRTNFGIYQKDIEMVTSLSAEGLYNDISAVFSQPVSVSLTMANDSLLKNFLTHEKNNLTDKIWQENMREYLNTYKKKYNYDSVFLVSTATNNYYHFEGLDRNLTMGNAENEWYYSFLNSDEEHALNVDNDEAKDNNITVFVNCKIKDEDGTIMGIVGVGLQVNSLQALLNRYEEKYGVHTYLVDKRGIIEISSSVTGYEQKNLFDTHHYMNNKNTILKNRGEQKSFWYSSKAEDGYVVTQYEPNLKWHLIVENDTSAVNKKFSMQFLRNISIIALIILLVLFIITNVIKRYNAQILKMTVSQELEYQRLLHEMTEGLYEDIFEWDITHNCARGKGTRNYFNKLGVDADTPYDQALHIIAEKQIKSEHIERYVDTFSPQALMKAFENGTTNLSYDLLFAEDGINYHWIRISARIFFWNSDKSIRMITYRENIDLEKKREMMLLESVQKDSMTGLYNKRATEDLITEVLKSEIRLTSKKHALLIFDIDNFKAVNDSLGHSFGDYVINELAAEIKTQFRENDIVGRIGGDEFVVLMKNVDNIDRLKQKLTRLCSKIGNKNIGKSRNFTITCSIGVVLYPDNGETYSELYEKADQALYHAKNHGKNSFVLFGEFADEYSFQANQRDMEELMNAITDGLAQFACTEPMKLLYFNQKCAELFGIPTVTLSAQEYNPLDPLHPDDFEEVSTKLKVASIDRKPFTMVFRIRHQDGHYVLVRATGMFINELYKNQYPIFYLMYTKIEDQVDK